MKRKLLFIISMVLVMTMVAGCFGGGNGGNGQDNGEPSDGDVQLEPEKITDVTIYFMKMTDTSFQVEGESREIIGEFTIEKLAQELVAGPQSQGLERIIPEDVDLLGVELRDDIAYIDFSDDIMAGYYGGESESVLLTSIVWTLTEHPDVEAVQILVEGEVVDSIGGHIEITEPLRKE